MNSHERMRMNDQTLPAGLERLFRRVMLMIGRGRLTTGRDDGPVQRHQARLGALEVRDHTPRLAEYGFASMPPVGSDAVVVFIGGDRSNGVIIATGHQASRLNHLKAGEAALYDDLGQRVILTRHGIVIEGAGLPVTLRNTPEVTLKASAKVRIEAPVLECTGQIIDQCNAGGRSMAHMRAVYDAHTHGGIERGGSQTQPPRQTT
ncbi:Putative Phage baseplate assembly protein V [Candidatus Glomeribacter gigasporarum BEG34]|uniref:Putative Phage baseplate assembly protein V n=1 Tax=Candidatus Glomeribacter gigasporarum BEG34 TaxID=1070319 RepID=G2JC38_9BURK|nr:phage baseplate assembly protein V [Candidatus Glomeribacter gigasporarum]CCD30345.1 Putative Phage baseplate assembly protein V [Candidatus Glomeribacter gigasporarum BEG34]